MSFLKRLFGGGKHAGNGAADTPTTEHEGYTIRATPISEGGQFRLAAVISKVIDGEVKEHRLIRADLFTSADEAAETAIRKARQVIAEQGDRMFD